MNLKLKNIFAINAICLLTALVFQNCGSPLTPSIGNENQESSQNSNFMLRDDFEDQAKLIHYSTDLLSVNYGLLTIFPTICDTSCLIGFNILKEAGNNSYSGAELKNARLYLSQELDIDPSKRYRFSVDVRYVVNSNLKLDPASINIHTTSSKPALEQYPVSIGKAIERSDFEWRTYSLYIEPQLSYAGSSYTMFLHIGSPYDTIYIDNLRLEEI